MRLLVLTLLLANLLFFGWQYLLLENKPVTPLDSYQDVPALELASPENPDVLVSDQDSLPEVEGEISDPLMAETEELQAEPLVPEQETAPAEEPEPAVCADLGPFDNEDAARAAIEAFSLSRFNPLVKTQQVSRQVYWVYIPPFRDRSSANLALSMLASRGIKDAYIVGSGEDRNAIALGLYSEEERANRRQEQLGDIGMAARISVVDRSASVFFLSMEMQRLEDVVTRLPGPSAGSPLALVATECEAQATGEEADAN